MPMPNKYTAWIKDNVADNYGTCKEMTQRMEESFPELHRVRGHYHCPVWGSREHWWLADLDGNIVDPTAGQFPSGGMSCFYEKWDETQKEPTGMCPNCGEYCYDGSYCCSDACHRAFVASLGM